MGLGVEDTILPIVPLFHANAWGIAFSAPAVGAKLVMPGAKMDGESVFQLLDSEKVTFSAAVPTVWLMLKQYLEETGNTLPYLKRVVIGGSAVPEAILKTFEDNYDVQVFHAWGMTEMSPMGSMGSTVPEFMAQGTRGRAEEQAEAGPCAVRRRVEDHRRRRAKSCRATARSAGHLLVRGPAVAGSYFKNDGGQILDKDGFFDTGDVANLCELGYMQITDRAKDVIKSGGEWISSIDIENFAVGHPAVANAAAIGLPHPKWDERPLLIIELKPGQSVTP